MRYIHAIRQALEHLVYISLNHINIYISQKRVDALYKKRCFLADGANLGNKIVMAVCEENVFAILT